MPVPQQIKFLVGWAEEPPQNQQARCLFHNTSSFLWGGPKSPPKTNRHLARPKPTGKMPVPQYIKFLVGWAEEPAQNQQARCLFHNTSSFLWGGHLAPPKIQFSCGTAYQLLKRRIFIL